MPILLTLDRAKVSGSLELPGDWEPRQVPTFPEFSFPRTFDNPLLPTLREILAAAPTIQVTQDEHGIVRMRDPAIPEDILNVRIAHIEFRGNGIDPQGPNYDPDDSLAAIMRAPEMVAFKKANGFGWPAEGMRAVPGNFSSGYWPPQQPHLSGALNNVSLSEALDYVLKTFPGIWVYANYPATVSDHRNVYFGFFRLDKSGHSVYVVQ